MSKVEEFWIIKRDDGAFYRGWQFDYHYKAIPNFTNKLFEVILRKKVFNRLDAIREIKGLNLKNCRPVKVKIEIVGEDDE